MDERTSIRYAVVAGIVFVVLTVVSLFLAGVPPKPDAPVTVWRAFYSDHRGAILLGVMLRWEPPAGKNAWQERHVAEY